LLRDYALIRFKPDTVKTYSIITKLCLKNTPHIFHHGLGLGTYLFVKVPRPGDSELRDLFGLRVKLPHVTTSLTTQRY